MVLKTDDHATLIDFATKVLESRLREIQAVQQQYIDGNTTAPSVWNAINEIMERK